MSTCKSTPKSANPPTTITSTAAAAPTARGCAPSSTCTPPTAPEPDRRGLGAIAGYRVLATLSPPEYYSQAMMNAIMAYQNGGGRHLALGANGFYWRCS